MLDSGVSNRQHLLWCIFVYARLYISAEPASRRSNYYPFVEFKGCTVFDDFRRPQTHEGDCLCAVSNYYPFIEFTGGTVLDDFCDEYIVRVRQNIFTYIPV